MTAPQWYFREFRPGDNASDPDFARALFSRDESAAARSLVRESIQNSLDARSRTSSAVRVRFALHTGDLAANFGQARLFLEGAWPHFESSNSGLEAPPSQADRIPYLVVEDFGTRGLTGNPATWDPFEADKNSFFLFFRALGRSGKEGEDRGRWGVGKFVFPMASDGHCLLSMTVPEGATPLVMGRMVLKTHRADGRSYHPDGHWGRRLDAGLVLPSSDPDAVDEFRRVFRLQRKDEPGLSVVVPWVIDSITAESILESVAGEYFLPIFRNELTAEIEHNGKVTLLDADRLSDLAESIESDTVRARVNLAYQVATWPVAAFLTVPRPDSAVEYDWVQGRLTDEQRAFAGTKLETGDVVAFRVHTSVRPKNAASRNTFFDVFIREVRGLGRARPLIVREGITVSEDKTSFLQDYVALVVVDDPALAGFVGDAETPAHNELQFDLVKSKYTLAGKLIHLLRTAPAALIREIEGSDREADHGLLSEFFPMPAPSALPRRPAPKRAPKGDDTEEVPPIPFTPPRFRVAQTDSGFAVRGTGQADAGTRLVIRCAYEVRRGNPLRKYEPLDFILGKDVDVSSHGVEVESMSENQIVCSVTDPFFEVETGGFDPNRNLVVRVHAEDAG